MRPAYHVEIRKQGTDRHSQGHVLVIARFDRCQERADIHLEELVHHLLTLTLRQLAAQSQGAGSAYAVQLLHGWSQGRSAPLQDIDFGQHVDVRELQRHHGGQ